MKRESLAACRDRKVSQKTVSTAGRTRWLEEPAR